MRKSKLLLILAAITAVLFIFTLLTRLLAMDIVPGIFGTLFIQLFLLCNGILFSNFRKEDIFKFPTISTFAVIIGTYLATMCTLLAAFLIMMQFTTPDTNLVQEKMQSMGLFAIIFAVIIAPICEEIFFRGAMYEWIKNRATEKAGRKVAIALATIISAAIFAASHVFYGSTYELIAALVFGISLALLYEWKGIQHTILMHIMINGVSLAVMFALKMAG